MRPQILTINQNKITWELNDENGISTILYGAYIGKDILMIAKHLWEKQGTGKCLVLTYIIIYYLHDNSTQNYTFSNVLYIFQYL